MINFKEPQGVKPIGINLDTLKKGKTYNEQDVLLTFRHITPDLDEKLAKFERGETTILEKQFII